MVIAQLVHPQLGSFQDQGGEHVGPGRDKQDKKAELVGDPTLADAILDRIVHNACKINLKGESMRKKVRLYPEGIV